MWHGTQWKNSYWPWCETNMNTDCGRKAHVKKLHVNRNAINLVRRKKDIVSTDMKEELFHICGTDMKEVLFHICGC
jgi:hypothetical protein